MIKYSKETGGFYPKDFAGNLPKDVVEITEELYFRLLRDNSEGRVIKSNEKGHPFSDEVTVNTSDSEVMWVDVELRRAGEELDKVQDSDPSAFGSVSEWRTYRKALRAWVKDVKFPNKDFRPTSPGA